RRALLSAGEPAGLRPERRGLLSRGPHRRPARRTRQPGAAAVPAPLSPRLLPGRTHGATASHGGGGPAPRRGGGPVRAFGPGALAAGDRRTPARHLSPVSAGKPEAHLCRGGRPPAGAVPGGAAG